jgi:hypothetical protein
MLKPTDKSALGGERVAGLQEAVKVGVLDEPLDMEKIGQLKLVQDGFNELAAREDLKEDLERIKGLVSRLGY